MNPWIFLIHVLGSNILSLRKLLKYLRREFDKYKKCKEVMKYLTVSHSSTDWKIGFSVFGFSDILNHYLCRPGITVLVLLKTKFRFVFYVFTYCHCWVIQWNFIWKKSIMWSWNKRFPPRQSRCFLLKKTFHQVLVLLWACESLISPFILNYLVSLRYNSFQMMPQ